MPCGVTSQMGPTFSVTSMRPSGRKAMRQGRLKVATDVMLNGTLASGFWSPAFTWAATGAYAPPDNNATSRAVFAILVIGPSFAVMGREDCRWGPRCPSDALSPDNPLTARDYQWGINSGNLGRKPLRLGIWTLDRVLALRTSLGS